MATISEKYYDRALKLKQENPELTSTDLIRILKYKGSAESFRGVIVKPINKLLGFRDPSTVNNFAPNTDTLLSSRPEMERFGDFDANGNAYTDFTDGYYIDPSPIQIPAGQKILVIGDQHIGIHSTRLCMIPIDYAVEKGGFDTVLINGDLLDFSSMSAHASSPYELMSFKDEIEQAKTYINIIKKKLPNVKIIYAEGNHEYRLSRWIACHAKEFQGVISLPKLLQLEHFGIEWVPYHKHVQVGILHMMHGHHIKGSGVSVANTILNKSMVNILSHDRHVSQEAIKRRFDGTVIGVTMVGCLCPLTASYALHNNWNNGFAEVHSFEDGTYIVNNKKIIDWKIY